jgi:hypothetical protein
MDRMNFTQRHNPEQTKDPNMKTKKTAKQVPAVVSPGKTLNLNYLNESINDAIATLMALQTIINEQANAVVEQKANEMIERVAAHEGITPAQLLSRAA